MHRIRFKKCDLTVKQKDQLQEFLYQNRIVFSSNLSHIGQSKTCQHQIDTGDALPVQLQLAILVLRNLF